MKLLLHLINLCSMAAVCSAWSTSNTTPMNRKQALASIGTSAAASVAFLAPRPANAFDGTGSSAYAGKSAVPRDILIQGYRNRVVADVKDFLILGKAIDRGDTDGDEWVAFFIPYQRREPDAFGRTYAACVDLIGDDGTGGVGFLLSGTYAKKGKPIETLPQMKKFATLSKTLPPIQKAAKSGSVTKAKKEWDKASLAFSDYLQEVGLPASLADPMYM